jgi:nitrate reductase gamma subunit
VINRRRGPGWPTIAIPRANNSPLGVDYTVVVPVMAVTFTVAWSAWAARTDGSGLWAVGVILVLIGTAAGATVVAGAGHLIHRRRPTAPVAVSRPIDG